MYRTGNLTGLDPITREELRKIEQAQTEPADALYLRTLTAEPTRIREGMTVVADGVDWEPLGLGTGGGVFTYYGSAWHKLG